MHAAGVAESEPADEAGSDANAALDGLQTELDEVALALERMDAGTYGTCETCGGAIEDAQLVAVPVARFCAEHRP